MLCYLSKLKPYRFRILALILFVFLLISTWLMFHQPPHHSKHLHLNLQTQLKQLITNTLSKKNPSIENIQFQKMWTQDGNNPNTIIASFQYSFDHEKTNTQVSGQATIVKQPPTSAKEHELWIVQSIQTDDTVLEIQDPVLFSKPNVDSENSNENLNANSEDSTEDSNETPENTPNLKPPSSPTSSSSSPSNDSNTEDSK